VQPGADLYVLNAGTRADPGSGRPSYTAAVQPIINGDGGNLALPALALSAVPGSGINAARNLATSTPPAQVQLLPPLGQCALVLLLAGAASVALRSTP
jgi:hypothetical protein